MTTYAIVSYRTRCGGWWDCLSSAEQTTLIAVGVIAVTAIVAALILRRR